MGLFYIPARFPGRPEGLSWGVMAKRKAKTRRATSSVVRVSQPRAAAPIINVRAPTAPKKRRSSGRRRSSGGGGSAGHGGLIQNAIGGFGFGFIEKTFPNLPTLPIVGRAGTIALIAHYMRGKFPYASQIAQAAASIAGYQLGATGKINGEDDGYDPIAHQVRGIAAQV